jgi:hypothetical protein
MRSVGWWVAGWAEYFYWREKTAGKRWKKGERFSVSSVSNQLVVVVVVGVVPVVPPLFSSSRERLTWLWPDDDGCPLLTSPSTR